MSGTNCYRCGEDREPAGYICQLCLDELEALENAKYETPEQYEARTGKWNEGYFYESELASVLCVTVESNIPWPGISKAPQPYERIYWLKRWLGKRMITVEPIMDFDVMTFSEMILSCDTEQVNIGADSGNNHLPEPSREKVEELIELLAPHTKVHLKKNLRRLLPEHRLYNADV
jgi:hypothetical protein